MHEAEVLNQVPLAMGTNSGQLIIVYNTHQSGFGFQIIQISVHPEVQCTPYFDEERLLGENVACSGGASEYPDAQVVCVCR